MDKISFQTKVAKKFLNLQQSAFDRGLEFNLTLTSISNLLQAKRCFYTGNALHSHNLSIDRVDNSKGYIIGNVVACDRRVNTLKADLDLKSLKKFSARILKLCES